MRLEAAEMWFLMRMLRISWMDRVKNEEVLSRAKVRRNLLSKIRQKQLQFLGHIMRKDGLENLMLTGRIEGMRGRGRRRVSYMSCIGKWLEMPVQQVLKATRERKLWRTMITNALKGHGT